MYVRLKNATAATKKGVEYRLKLADGKLGKGFRLSCDRWTPVPDADFKNLAEHYGEKTFETSEEETVLTPAKVTLGVGPARARAGDPQNPKTHAASRRKTTAASEEGDLEADKDPDVQEDKDPVEA
jgi:hypothetical protein